jgi:uncharacterized protein DUF3179
VYDPLIAGKRFTFGTSGKLYKSSLVMYDRQTESLWSQILEEAITGPMTGTKLKVLPVQDTIWREWRSEHPDTMVLSPATGFQRDYGHNPYETYYEQGVPFGGPRTRAHQLDPDLASMERVLGVQVEGVTKAYPFSRLKKQPPQFPDSIGGKNLAIHFDAKSESAYAIDSSGRLLPSLVTFWFAWADFYPDTLVFTASPDRSK